MKEISLPMTSLKSVKYKPGQHPNSRKNLRPFHPGENGNQHSGYSLTDQLRDSLRRPLVPPGPKAPAGEHIVYATLEGAKLREPKPLDIVWDRVEGKLIERREVIGDIRAVTIVVGSEDSKKLVEQLLAGERALPGGRFENRRREA